jgi:serine/threonine protein kinase
MEPTIARDIAVAQAAVDLHFITSTQLDECLTIQKNMATMGINDELSTIMVKKGYITSQQLKVIEQAYHADPDAPPQAPVVTFPKIKGFEIESILGKGGMGTVYGARQTSIDRFVALKVLKPDLAKEKEYVERFVREAKAVAKLSHKNIVMAYDVGESNGTYYMAMEYVNGRPLHRIIKERGRLDEKEAIRIAMELCQALSYIHDNRMIHRDVKPENVLVPESGSPKLLDLGLARTLQNEDANITLAGVAMGTPNYISPEQITGQRDLDIRCDIYALGGTLYAMVTGKAPYAGETPAVVFAKHLHDPIPDPRKLNPSVSEGLTQVIVKCLAKERKDRYSTPRQLLSDLEALAQGKVQTPIPKAVKVAPPRPFASARVIPEKSSSAMPIVLGVLAVVLIGAGIFFLLPKSRPSAPVVQRPAPTDPQPVKPTTNLDALREEQAQKAWADAQAHIEGQRWAEALKPLNRLLGELAVSQFMSANKAKVEKAAEECNAKLTARKSEAEAFEKKARESLAARKWADAAEAYTKLVNNYSDLVSDKLAAFRDALALCDREMQVENLYREAKDAMAAENWEVARSAVVMLQQTYSNTITASSRQAELSQWEKTIRDELFADTAIGVLAREVAEKKWSEARKTLAEGKKRYSITITYKKRRAEIDALEAQINEGIVKDAEKEAAGQLKIADDAFASKKWTLAKETYLTIKSTYAQVPVVQSRMADITKRIQDCDQQLKLVVEHTAKAVWAMANSFFNRGEFEQALPWYEKLASEYRDTKAYRDRQSEVTKRIAECISKSSKEK